MGKRLTTLADFRQVIQVIVRRMGNTFRDPDDDWRPVSFVQTERGIELAMLPEWAFQSGAIKDALADSLRAAIALIGAYRYALLLNTHYSGEMSDGEMLILIVGDAETEEHWMAAIERDGRRPPRLGPWQPPNVFFGIDLPEGAELGFEGRFIDMGTELRRGRR